MRLGRKAQPKFNLSLLCRSLIVFQHTRLNSRESANTLLLSTLAYGAPEYPGRRGI